MNPKILFSHAVGLIKFLFPKQKKTPDDVLTTDAATFDDVVNSLYSGMIRLKVYVV